MNPLLLTFISIEKRPKMLLRMDDLRRCPGSRDHERGIVVDADCDCYREICDSSKAPPPKPRKPQPGDIIGYMIEAAGFKPVAGCGCAAFKAWMNAAGWWVCLRERKKIVAWFIEKAKDAGVEVTSARASSLLAAGVKEICKRRLSK